MSAATHDGNPAASSVTLYTDGACPGNGTVAARGGWAFVAVAGDQVVGRGAGAVGAGAGATNNAMEMVAIREALRSTPEGASVIVATDSANAIGWMFSGWKAKVPHIKAVVSEILALMEARSVTHLKVKGHSGDRFNTMVDDAAVRAARGEAAWPA